VGAEEEAEGAGSAGGGVSGGRPVLTPTRGAPAVRVSADASDGVGLFGGGSG
jgi:hypothetical protein